MPPTYRTSWVFLTMLLCVLPAKWCFCAADAAAAVEPKIAGCCRAEERGESRPVQAPPCQNQPDCPHCNSPQLVRPSHQSAALTIDAAPLWLALPVNPIAGPAALVEPVVFDAAAWLGNASCPHGGGLRALSCLFTI